MDIFVAVVGIVVAVVGIVVAVVDIDRLDCARADTES